MMPETASALLARLVADLRADSAVCLRKGEALASCGADQSHRSSTEMLVERSLDMRGAAAKGAGDAVVLDGREQGVPWQALGVEIGAGIALVVMFDAALDADVVASGVLVFLPALRGLFSVPGSGEPGQGGPRSGGQGSSGAASVVRVNEGSPLWIRRSN